MALALPNCKYIAMQKRSQTRLCCSECQNEAKRKGMRSSSAKRQHLHVMILQALIQQGNKEQGRYWVCKLSNYWGSVTIEARHIAKTPSFGALSKTVTACTCCPPFALHGKWLPPPICHGAAIRGSKSLSRPGPEVQAK